MHTKVEYLLDTNILIYAASANETERTKKIKAAELLKSPFGTSTQVIQEFYTTVRRKPDRPLTAAEALQWVKRLELQPCAVVDIPLIQSATEISQRYRISYWDGAILAAAERLGTDVVYTEDLNHGQSYGPVRVVNPFI
ncbi:PIN domain-containing protein [Methyloceanibacter sp.]|uniref:PIN domain-containing protein n=1 Tax=Methyloceanibacter sp. TaxID=1965321 RepID=UPI002D328274|nr:PIN domain-containing protein [Methyloceanibacter sp.]HZP10572.1 PIN domain-containing protein [Methyloceanibacter sp.]